MFIVTHFSRQNALSPYSLLFFSHKQQGIFYMHFCIDRTTHTTTIGGPVVDHWLCHTWRLGHQCSVVYSVIYILTYTSTMTWYPNQSHYHGTKPTSPCHILILLSAWLGIIRTHYSQRLSRISEQGNKKYQFLSHWNRTTDLPHTKSVLYLFAHRAWQKNKTKKVLCRRVGR